MRNTTSLNYFSLTDKMKFHWNKKWATHLFHICCSTWCLLTAMCTLRVVTDQMMHLQLGKNKTKQKSPNSHWTSLAISDWYGIMGSLPKLGHCNKHYLQSEQHNLQNIDFESHNKMSLPSLGMLFMWFVWLMLFLKRTIHTVPYNECYSWQNSQLNTSP